MSHILGLFTSVRTTIVLLSLLAVGSIVGTILPQGTDFEHFGRSASPFFVRLALILDLNTVYRSWWFVLLLVLLACNLLGCMFQRLPRIPREWRGEGDVSSLRISSPSPRSVDELQRELESALTVLLRVSPQVVTDKGARSLLWVKHRAYLFAFPFIHVAIIVILLGGLIGLKYGIKGSITIPEGETGKEFALIPSERKQALPFDVAVDRFTLKRYPTGEPMEYRSDVRILKDGKEVKKASIRVNQPVTYEGFSLYQADYRVLGVRTVRFTQVDEVGGTKEFSMVPGEEFKLPGTEAVLKLSGLDPGATKRGPWVEVTVSAGGREPDSVMIFRSDPQPADILGAKVRFLDYDPLYATGLQVGYDPGTNVVWLGCGLLVLGFYLTLFTNYRRLRVEIRPFKKGSQLLVTGRSRKLRREFRQSVESIVRPFLSPGSRSEREAIDGDSD